MRKRDLKIIKNQFHSKEVADLKKKIRKLKFEIKQEKRLRAEATTSQRIIEIQVTIYKSKFEEQQKKHSIKRTRILQPNNKLILSHPMLVSERHPLAQKTTHKPLSDPIIDPK